MLETDYTADGRRCPRRGHQRFVHRPVCSVTSDLRIQDRREMSDPGRASLATVTLMNRVQRDDRYLALGLELIVGVGRPKFERFFPKSEAFLARRHPGPRVHLLGPDLYFDLRVRENVAIPPWVLGRASL